MKTQASTSPGDLYYPPNPARVLATDSDDAERLLRIFRVLPQLVKAGAPLADVNRMAREVMKSVWEVPRRPGPMIGQYPAGVPWSPRARLRYQTRGPRGITNALRLEHVIPISETTQTLMQHAPQWGTAEAIDVLREHSIAAVITKQDDRRLNRLRDDKDHPWSRYQHKFDLTTFIPLSDELEDADQA